MTTPNTDEVVYGKLGEIEHVLNSPDMYLGELVTKDKIMLLYDIKTDEIKIDKITYNTGLLKLFDELLINAVDNYQRTSITETKAYQTNEININVTNEYISIMNNGKSIPIQLVDCNTDKGLKKMYIPEMIFTQLRSGSNFKKDGKREIQTVGGKNGVGCKIVSIFSDKFIIDIVNNNTHYLQEVRNQVKEIDEPVIRNIDHKDYVKITFFPNWKLLKSNKDEFSTKVHQMFYKRAFDISYLPIHVTINDKLINSSDKRYNRKNNWINFVEKHNALYTDNLCHHIEDRWLVSFGLKQPGVKLKFISFVNYISTYEGGTHVDRIVDQFTDYIKTIYKKDKITSAQVRDKIMFFISAIIDNPDFNSQAKEKLTTSKRSLVKECEIPKKLIKQFIVNNNFIEILDGKMVEKANTQSKKINIHTIPKVINAEKAGTKEGYKCTLFLCEGDSANTMCIRGISAMGINGSKYFGSFPLRGKPLNTRNVSTDKYLNNIEWNNVKAIIGLEDGKEYDDVKKLNYGQIVCVKDADTDGASIMGLIINFFADKFPSLLQIPGFISEFVSPMIKLTFPLKYKNKISDEIMLNRTYKIGNNCMLPFYNKREFENFKSTIPESVKKIKYIKGLGTNESTDVVHYFKNYEDNKLELEFEEDTFKHIDKAFNLKRADDRKHWLDQLTEDTFLPRQKGVPIKCNDFIDNDLLTFSYDNCIRSIPSSIDGLKPTQRKILFTVMKESPTKEMKVTELGGYVIKETNYHHGNVSVEETIIKMAQDYVGSNNIPLLRAIGEFGTRYQNGNDAASPRYLHTMISPVTRYIFPVKDDSVLEYVQEEGKVLEPKVFVPIIPMILVNGAEGIGTGWSTSIPCFSVKDIINATKELIKDDCYEINNDNLRSYYNGFKGLINFNKDTWTYHGVYSLNDTTLKITELPIGKLALSIFEVRELLKQLQNDKKVIKWSSNDKLNPDFTIELDNKYSESSIVSIFKLKTTIKNTNMVAFNDKNKIYRYDTLYDLFMDWYFVRYETYEKRIEFILNKLKETFLEISNKCRFIKEIIAKTLIINDRRKDDIIQDLVTKNYDKINDKYDYLLSMAIYSLTKEKIIELEKKLEEIEKEIDYYENVSVSEIWMKELVELEKMLELVESEKALEINE